MLKPVRFDYTIEGIGLHNDRVDGLLIARKVVADRAPTSQYDVDYQEYVEMLGEIDRLIDQNK